MIYMILFPKCHAPSIPRSWRSLISMDLLENWILTLCFVCCICSISISKNIFAKLALLFEYSKSNDSNLFINPLSDFIFSISRIKHVEKFSTKFHYFNRQNYFNLCFSHQVKIWRRREIEIKNLPQSNYILLTKLHCCLRNYWKFCAKR